jgi:hypothetical protein
MIDRWWNEPTNQQAIDRLHRISQKNAVQVIYPICNDSVDSVLDTIISRKLEDGKNDSITKAIIEERMRKPRKEFVNLDKIEDIKNVDISADEFDLNLESSMENIEFVELNKEMVSEPPNKEEEKEEIKPLLLLAPPKVIHDEPPQEDEYERMMKQCQ